MSFEEFLVFRDVKIKSHAHERVVKLFYAYLESVTGNNRLLKEVLGNLLSIDFSSMTLITACFNGIYDTATSPYENVDLYIKFDSGVCVFVYGSIPLKPIIQLKNNEHVLFVLSNSLDYKEKQIDNHYYFV
jgi:hypothetical protein